MQQMNKSILTNSTGKHILQAVWNIQVHTFIHKNIQHVLCTIHLNNMLMSKCHFFFQFHVKICSFHFILTKKGGRSVGWSDHWPTNTLLTAAVTGEKSPPQSVNMNCSGRKRLSAGDGWPFPHCTIWGNTVFPSFLIPLHIHLTSWGNRKDVSLSQASKTGTDELKPSVLAPSKMSCKMKRLWSKVIQNLP